MKTAELCMQMRATAPVCTPKGPPPGPPLAGLLAAGELSSSREPLLMGATVLRVPSAAAMAASPKTGDCAAADDPNGPEVRMTTREAWRVPRLSLFLIPGSSIIKFRARYERTCVLIPSCPMGGRTARALVLSGRP